MDSSQPTSPPADNNNLLPDCLLFEQNRHGSADIGLICAGHRNNDGIGAGGNDNEIRVDFLDVFEGDFSVEVQINVVLSYLALQVFNLVMDVSLEAWCACRGHNTAHVCILLIKGNTVSSLGRCCRSFHTALGQRQ